MKIVNQLVLSILLWGYLSTNVVAQPALPDWPVVGKATFKWMFWTVYHAKLSTPEGEYHDKQLSLALSLDYQMDIDANDLLEQTGKEWQKLGYSEAVRQDWLKILTTVWPDIEKDDRLTFVLTPEQGQFYHNKQFIGSIKDKTLCQAFIAIWLAEKSDYTRQQRLLTGQQ